MLRIRIFIILFLGLPFFARGDTFNAGDVATYTFTTNPVAFPCPGTCDTLVVSPNYTGLVGSPRATAQLFDGTALLGTFTAPSCCVFAFEAAGSLFDFGAPIVDFTEILDGSIAGRITFSVTGGSIVGLQGPGTFLVLGHSFGAGGLSEDIRSATLTGFATTPEPASGILLALAVALLITFSTVERRFRR